MPSSRIPAEPVTCEPICGSMGYTTSYSQKERWSQHRNSKTHAAGSSLVPFLRRQFDFLGWSLRQTRRQRWVGQWGANLTTCNPSWKSRCCAPTIARQPRCDARDQFAAHTVKYRCRLQFFGKPLELCVEVIALVTSTCSKCSARVPRPCPPSEQGRGRGSSSVVLAPPVPAVLHSSRSRIMGSTDSARRAGIHVASNPSRAIARTTPANTSGSRGVA
jgi:hypothetical protein